MTASGIIPADLPAHVPAVRQAVPVEAEVDADGTVRLALAPAEALVLFEWLHRGEDVSPQLDQLAIEDDAERQVLWSISACLESTLIDPFRPEYLDRLETARASLRAEDGDA